MSLGSMEASSGDTSSSTIGRKRVPSEVTDTLYQYRVNSDSTSELKGLSRLSQAQLKCQLCSYRYELDMFFRLSCSIMERGPQSEVS